jgi:hypothetical protein
VKLCPICGILKRQEKGGSYAPGRGEITLLGPLCGTSIYWQKGCADGTVQNNLVQSNRIFAR